MTDPLDLDLDLPLLTQPAQGPVRLDPESARKRDAWRRRNRLALGPPTKVDLREIPTVPFEWKD